MDFLESAEILLPALIDMPMTIYGGQEDALHHFELYWASNELNDP